MNLLLDQALKQLLHLKMIRIIFSNIRNQIQNPIKLSANESALGASPKAIEAFEKEKNKVFKYPEDDSNSLREVLSDEFKIDSKRIICGSGSDQIFDLTCRLFLSPEDEVIVTEFGFIMYKI